MLYRKVAVNLNREKQNMETFKTFPTSQEARTYRHQYGTGGWIFAPEHGKSILFPPEYYPTMIFHHPFTKGQSGELIGSQ